MVLGNVGQNCAIVFTTCHTVQNKSVTGNFHNNVVTASILHCVKSLLQIHHVRGSVVGFGHFVLDHNVDSTNQAHLIACTTQNSADDIGSGSFAIGTGDAQHTHIFAGIIVKIRNNGFHRLTSIGNNKESYALRDFFRNILHQRGNSALFYSHLQKFMTINGCTLQADEQATFLYNAGVCSNIGNNFIVSA